MSKTATATDACCRLFPGAFRAVLAALVLLPGAVEAADAGPALRRSDQVNLERLGKLSEDERSVLRIEWRAGMAGVDETRHVDGMLDKLRRLESGINEVSQLVRAMPAKAPAAVAPATPAPSTQAPASPAPAKPAPETPTPAAAHVAAAMPGAADATEADGFDTRLAVANAAALALVALWWFRRRKPATEAETPPASLPPQVPPAPAALRTSTSPVAKPQATVPAPAPAAPPPAATPEPIVVAAVPSGGEAPRQAAAPQPAAPAAPPATAAAPAPASSAPLPAESFDADRTMILNFSLEEADPETVAREHARLAAIRPTSPPEPPPPAPVEHTVDVEPTLQLAEIMLSMGLEEGAAQALIEYTEANPRHAIYHWLKLLGIYRSRGLQHEFAQTAEKLRMYFNIQAAEWGSPPASEAPTLENFSRVAEHVQKIWRQPEECTAYLRRLLEDNREGARAGFPQSVAEEILLLVEIVKETSGATQTAA